LLLELSFVHALTFTHAFVLPQMSIVAVAVGVTRKTSISPSRSASSCASGPRADQPAVYHATPGTSYRFPPLLLLRFPALLIASGR